MGEPSVASYGTLHFTRGDTIDTGQTEFVTAGSADGASKQPPPDPSTGKPVGAPLRLGILLTYTGDLAKTATPIWAGAHLGIKEVTQDPEARELSEHTAVDSLARELQKKLPEETL